MKKGIVTLGCMAVILFPLFSSAQPASEDDATETKWPIPYEYKRVIFGDRVTSHENPALQQAAEAAEASMPVNEKVSARNQTDSASGKPQEAGAKAASGPSAAAQEEDTWDFGSVKEGEVLQYEFSIDNKSASRSLKILAVNTSCGCTASQAKSNILAPGESTTLSVRFETKGYAGPVKQYVYVHTDDPEENIRRFTIKANVKAGLQ